MPVLSVIEPIRFIPAGPIVPIDIETGFTEDDYLTIACPDFPSADITFAACFVDVTSNPLGDFDAGPTDALCFADVIPDVYPIPDIELRFPRSMMTTIDRSALTGVRFRITATDTCNFHVAAVRFVSTSWKASTLDIDTLYNRMERPVARDADIGAPVEFPTNAFSAEPNDFPILWRSDSPSGTSDPRPIDVSASIWFESGSLTDTTSDIEGETLFGNEIHLYFREDSRDQLTQLDLDGDYTMADLDALGHQPELGDSRFDNRTQESLEAQDQGQLNAQDQFELERVNDDQGVTWLRMSLIWDELSGTLAMATAEGVFTDYTWDVGITANEHYVLFATVLEREFVISIYGADELGNVDWDNVIFTTTRVIDSSFVKRRKGRFGWYAKLLDGDAFVNKVRVRGINYAEYRSTPFRSLTPVTGARLTIGGTLVRDLYNGISAGPWGGDLALDTSKSISQQAIKITANGEPLQGAQTNLRSFDDFDNTVLKFRVWWSKAAWDANARLSVFLLGENIRIVPLHVPALKLDAWTDVRIPLALAGSRIQTGNYRVVFVQSTANVSSVFWLDSVRIEAQMVTWSARAKHEDAWGLVGSPWTPFSDTLNDPEDGIVFPERGNAFQIRGQARRYDAKIAQIKAQPKYAELGRFVWSDQRETFAAPIVTFTQSHVGLTATLDASANDHAIYQWDFGDGERDFGPRVAHTFPGMGVYSVTLSIISTVGQRAAFTDTVIVP